MKGKKKRNKFKVGNQAFLSRYDSLATNQDCNGVAPSTDPSTPPSSSLEVLILKHERQKKRNKFKVGNQAFLSRYDSLATNQDCNGVAPSTDPSTPPSSSWSNKSPENNIKTAFANDMKLRSHGIMKSLFMKYNGDRQKISKCLPGIVWSVNQVEMKLSQNALDQMKYFSNTNKCESINRTMSTYLHKNKNFSYNAIGRASEAGLAVNNNRDVALVKTLKAVGCTMGKSLVLQ
ncbi:unnamed protein product [Mytilus coruscus]|uniref:Uncharacterized protein n=1 Tax=Mytilus coruscus TaxID=42192 RepID=A0A6J8AKD8_MYTCO|nr:unnamed protein product [Mytilus coruscus]